MTLTMVADYLAQVIPAHEPDAAPMLQDMRDAIQRANRVISELLEFSRPGELTLKPEDFHAVGVDVPPRLRQARQPGQPWSAGTGSRCRPCCRP